MYHIHLTHPFCKMVTNSKKRAASKHLHTLRPHKRWIGGMHLIYGLLISIPIGTLHNQYIVMEFP